MPVEWCESVDYSYSNDRVEPSIAAFLMPSAPET